MRKRVMLVEDDVVIRDNYADILGEEGFEVGVLANTQSLIIPSTYAHSKRRIGVNDHELQK